LIIIQKQFTQILADVEHRSHQAVTVLSISFISLIHFSFSFNFQLSANDQHFTLEFS